MYLKHEPTGELVEVIDLQDVINPHASTIRARAHGGEPIQKIKDFIKAELVFPSDEPLPKCWLTGIRHHNHAAA